MSHMEHANGFTPTHTEHKIISYPAYQTAEEKKVWREKNPKNVKSGNTETDRLLTQAKGILE